MQMLLHSLQIDERLEGADWRHPYGPKSNIKGLDGHPVVHVAFADTLAYAMAGKIFRPRPSGSLPRAADSMAPVSLGRRVHPRRQAYGEHLAG